MVTMTTSSVFRATDQPATRSELLTANSRGCEGSDGRVEKHSNGMPRICWHTTLTCGNPQCQLRLTHRNWSSNPLPSTGESANSRSLSSGLPKRKAPDIYSTMTCPYIHGCGVQM